MVRKKLYKNGYLTIATKRVLERMYQKEIDLTKIEYDVRIDTKKKRLVLQFYYIK